MNIVSLYFVLWLTVDKNCPEIYYSLSLSGSIILAGIAMPLLGEISDRTGIRIPFLIALTLGCVCSTAMLGVTGKVFIALIFFALANFCYQLAGVTYNSLLVRVSEPTGLGKTSGLGVSLGYLGSILGLILVKPFLDSGGRSATFIPTAVLFLIFAVPSFIFIKDPPRAHIPDSDLEFKSILARLFKTILHIRQNKALTRFLICIFLCLNAVNTVVVYMGVYAKRVMGFSDSNIIYFMIFSILFAIAGSYGFGYLTDRLGSKRTLGQVIKLWCLALLFAIIAVYDWMFWIVGPLIGIALGGFWVSTRIMLIKLVPREKIGQMFGLLGLVNILSYIPGTILWGMITTFVFSGPSVFKYRIALFSVLGFMFAGYRKFRYLADPQKVALEN